jgi:hypothetical protein
LRMNIILEFVHMHCFHCALCPDGHKDRRFDRSVSGSD